MILIHCFGTRYKDGSQNAKTYPRWPELLKLLEPTHRLTQVGVRGDIDLVSDSYLGLSLPELTECVDACDLFVAIDSFLPHLAHLRKKRGVVLWGPSDPKIYGYPEHVHLHAVPPRFRPDQFGRWEGHPADPVAFADPVKVSQVINIIFNTEEEICDVR